MPINSNIWRLIGIAEILILIIALTGCSSLGARPACTHDALMSASLVKLEKAKEGARYELRNNHNCSLFYFHWLAQGPEPVAYCRSGQDEPWVCSTEVFGMEGADGEFFLMTHETVLPPYETTKFYADESNADAVGVRLWSTIESEEIYVWWELQRDDT